MKSLLTCPQGGAEADLIRMGANFFAEFSDTCREGGGRDFVLQADCFSPPSLLFVIPSNPIPNGHFSPAPFSAPTLAENPFNLQWRQLRKISLQMSHGMFDLPSH